MPIPKPEESEATTVSDTDGPPKRKRSAAETRKRILRAARTLISDQGYTSVSLDGIAAAAGISRQTIYLQFGSKIGVLTALFEEDEESGLPALHAALQTATGPLDLINKAIPLDMELTQKNYKLLRVFYAQAVIDPEFQGFWAYRMQHRRGDMRRSIEWLSREGQLAAGWSVDEATDWLFALTDFQAYERLVVQAGWSMDHLSRRMLEMIYAVLVRDGANEPEESVGTEEERS